MNESKTRAEYMKKDKKQKNKARGKGISISDIEISQKSPWDKDLLKLLSWSKNQKAPYQDAWINIDLIFPFSDYQPEIDSEYEEYFIKKLKEKKPVMILVYEKDGKFIMSDDFNAFYFYKKYELKEIPCSILGKYTKRVGVVEAGKPYQLGESYLEVVN